ncbi:hypothetical protein HYPSUDRAFT_200113 [Hypholoma sublateritium FD-334 SS-4]|uniref:Uncharacterized protein n=1 Tax=Hypholoma sublateritium (strain FD-334 SS-4) TaxID=945553 RepID=A0A0D2LC68_HYPSF|nr:hypothetical protein HYPSUDRAFT_200113 [Hypholoma sublateritium FD-334 SS-4]
MTTTHYIAQDLLPPSPSIPEQLQVRRIALRHAGDAVWHLTHPHAEVTTLGAARAIGIAYHTSPSGALAFVALATTHSIFHIDLPEDEKAPHVDSALAQLLGSERSSAAGDYNARPRLVGFTLARTAVRVQQVLRKPIRGVDVGKLDTSAEKDLTPAEAARQWLSRNANQWEITRLWLGDEHAVLQIDTEYLNPSELGCLKELITQSDLIESMKPKESTGDFNKISVNKFGKVEITNSRYKTRVRSSRHTQVIMTQQNGQQYIGTPHQAKGKKTMISMPGAPRNVGDITQVRVVGRQNLTNTEKAREKLIHCLLTGTKTLRESAFIRLIWFPLWKKLSFQDTRTALDQDYVDDIVSKMRLNDSQLKNIAETLFKKEVDFKLLVSKEFFEEW